MSTSQKFQPAASEFYLRRARRLRSEAAVSAVMWFGRVVLASIRRAYIRPYRMARTPGCGCEA